MKGLNYRLKLNNIVQFAEKYAKTNLSYLFKNGLWLSFQQAISIIISIIIAYVFANYSTKETYGLYKYILAMGGIIAIPTLPGLNTALSQSIANNTDSAIRGVLKMKIKWGILSFLLGLCFSIYYYISGEYDNSFLILICAIGVPLTEYYIVYQSILLGKKDFKKLSQGESFVNIVSAISTFTAIILGSGVVIILLCFFVPKIILYSLYLKNIKFNTKEDSAEVASVSKYGKHLSAMNILSTLSQNFDKLIIFNYLSVTELAIYSFALAVPDQTRAGYKIMGSLALPVHANVKLELILRSLRPKIIIAFVLGLIFAIIYYFLAPHLFEILFPQYIQSVPYSQAIAFSIAASTSLLPLSILKSKKKIKELYYVNTIGDISRILLLIVFTSTSGLIGAIIAKIINEYVILISSLVVLYKQKNIHI